MAFSAPSYGQAGSYTAASDRILNKANAVTAGVRRLIPAAGGLLTGDLAVVGQSNGTVTVAAGDVWINDSTSTGFYYSNNNVATASSAFANNPTGALRTDLIYLQVTDTGVAAPTVAIAIAAGSVLVPVMAIGLATITIPIGFVSGTTLVAGTPNVTITDLRKKAQLWDLAVASTSNVATPLSGSMVFDTSVAPYGKLKVYDTNGSWNTLAATVGTGFTNADMASGYTMLYQSATAPTSPTDGQLWFSTTTKRLHEYRSSDSTWQRIAHTITTGRTGTTLRSTAASNIIGNLAQTTMTIQTEDYDSDGFIAVPSSTVTIPAGLGGLYSVSFCGVFGVNPGSSAIFWAQITRSGTVYSYTGTAPGNSSGMPGNYSLGGTALVSLSVGDTIQFRVFHAQGGNVQVGGIYDIYRIAV